jgi:hypothetical protein
MIKVVLEPIDYISNGDPISAAALNKPSVDLRSNTETLASALEQQSSNTDTLIDLTADLVIDSDVTSAAVIGGVSPGLITCYQQSVVNSNNFTDKFYYVALRGNGSSQTSSQLELYSAAQNNSKIVIKQSVVSDFYGGYYNIPKARMLKNNGDSLALKLPKSGAGSVETYLLPTSVDDSDSLYYGASQEGLQLCKLPVLNKISIKDSITISAFKAYLLTATSNSVNCSFTTGVSGVGQITFSENNQAAAAINAKIYITVREHCLNVSVVTAILENNGVSVDSVADITNSTNIVGFIVSTSETGSPWNYTENIADADTLTINYKKDTDVSYTQVYNQAAAGIVKTSEPDTNYLYIPIATKVSSGIKFIDNCVPDMSISDIATGSSTLVLSKLFSARDIRNTSSRIVKLSSVIKTGDFFGRILCPQDIAHYMTNRGSSYSMRLLGIKVTTWLKPTNLNTSPGNKLEIRFRTNSDASSVFPGVTTFSGNLATQVIKFNLPDAGTSSYFIATDPTSPTTTSDYQVSQANILTHTLEMANNGNIGLLTFELTESQTSLIYPTSPPGVDDANMSQNIDISSNYFILVEADVLFTM